MQPDAQLDRLFVALADGARRAMIDQLSISPASVSELARPLQITLPSAIKHLAVLEAGGFVRSDKVGRVRTYRIAHDAFNGLDAWVSQRKTQWNAQFDQLAKYLGEES